MSGAPQIDHFSDEDAPMVWRWSDAAWALGALLLVAVILWVVGWRMMLAIMIGCALLIAAAIVFCVLLAAWTLREPPTCELPVRRDARR